MDRMGGQGDRPRALRAFRVWVVNEGNAFQDGHSQVLYVEGDPTQAGDGGLSRMEATHVCADRIPFVLQNGIPHNDLYLEGDVHIQVVHDGGDLWVARGALSQGGGLPWAVGDLVIGEGDFFPEAHVV